MSFNYNHCTLVGRVVKDAEMVAKNEVNRLSFIIAVDRPFKGKNNTTEADFLSIIMWGKLAELGFQFLKKGRPVLVEGRIQTRNYMAGDEKKYVTEIICENFQILESITKGN